VFYSFTSPPHLDVAVRPLGLPLPSVVPGVDTALRGVLSKLIGRRMVEPQRRYLDIHRIYLNKHIARVIVGGCSVSLGSGLARSCI
jgi:Ca2+-dependent lipid-binding protein